LIIGPSRRAAPPAQRQGRVVRREMLGRGELPGTAIASQQRGRVARDGPGVRCQNTRLHNPRLPQGLQNAHPRFVVFEILGQKITRMLADSGGGLEIAGHPRDTAGQIPPMAPKSSRRNIIAEGKIGWTLRHRA